MFRRQSHAPRVAVPLRTRVRVGRSRVGEHGRVYSSVPHWYARSLSMWCLPRGWLRLLSYLAVVVILSLPVYYLGVES